MSGAQRTPRELIQARFDWLQRADFSSIYRTYHPDAQFREHFPSEREYLQFANEHGLAKLELLRLEILDETVRGRLAKIFSLQKYRFGGELHVYLDVTTLRLMDDRWHVLSGKRVVYEASLDSRPLTRDLVEKHPQAVVY